MSAPDPAAWAALAADVRACTRCPLAGTRDQAVPGDGPGPGWRGLLLVGEGPGAEEDRSGQPFVGRSGRLLDELLAAAGLPRPDVAVANVVKCRPPGNRAPRAAEIAACRPWLVAQLTACAPALVVAMGGTAVRWFLGPRVRLTAARGRVHAAAPAGGTACRVLPTYHPSAALRFGPRGEPRRALAEDLALAARLVGDRPGQVPP